MYCLSYLPSWSFVLVLLPRYTLSVSFQEVSSLDLPAAAVASFVPQGLGPSPEEPSVLVTTFSPTATNDAIVLLPKLSSVKKGIANLSTFSVDNLAVWPNQADPFPAGMAGFAQINSTQPGILAAGGFFVNVPFHPSKATGAIDVLTPSLNGTNFEKHQISTNKDSFFYHKAAFLDANGDNLSDVITARCYVPPYGLRADQSELIWLEQPSSTNSEWQEHILLSSGPDVGFVLVDLPGFDGANTQVVSTEYFVNQRLALYWCNGSTWSDCSSNKTDAAVITEIIDDTEGAMFNLQWVDLNGDGAKDLLVTSQGDDGSGLVLAYEQPVARRSKQEDHTDSSGWVKHVLADGYKPLKAFLPGRGSPGTAVAFDAGPLSSSSRAWIVVSADDGGWVDLLVPRIDDGDDWGYEKTRVIQSTGTIGTPAVGDVDGDGIPEVFVPLYDEGRLAMYSISSVSQ